MIQREIIFGGRGCGKTYQIMTEIHELIRDGKRADILVIFPTMNYLHWWTREWQNRFPHVPMVSYTSMQAMDRVRGRRVKFVFIEDIGESDDGIYSEKLEWLYPCLSFGGTITFTCRTTLLGDRSHSRSKTKKEIRLETLRKMQKAAATKRAVEEAMMIDSMLTYINKADDERRSK